ncbi:MAG: glycosyltransferase family 39 protein, partial [Anaerolineae bacterium]|nr:glycosyltransferase family 39 protein [Anaerolineae bacterium]
MARRQGATPEHTGTDAGLFGVVLLIYLVLAVSYSIIVPIGRGADEWAHYWYAQFIADNGRLPNSAAERETAGYKSDWPPLYHLFAALITAPVETDGPPTFKYRADSIRRQLVPASGPEAILHTEDETFPWRQEVLVWHLGRILSIIFTTGTLLVTYRLALEVFGGIESLPGPPLPGKQALATATVAVLAFNPRFLFTGMLFNYDSLTLLLASLFLWLSIRIVNSYQTNWTFWGLGALAGLALVTKYLAAPLILVMVILAVIQPTAGHSPRPHTGLMSRLAQAGTAYVIVTAGWFTYLIATFNEIDRYGSLLGTLAPLIRGDGSDRTVEAVFAWLSGGQAPAPAFIERQSYTAWQIIAELPTTFWGNPVVRPYPLNWFIITMTILTLFAGLGLVRVWRAGQGDGRTRLLLLLTGYVLLPTPFMIIRLFGARDALEAVQGRHILFLAGAAFAVLFVWGLTAWPAARRVTLFVVPLLLLGGAM